MSSSGNPPPYLFGRRWQVIRDIGKGSFGAVYEALDVVNGLKVAIKIEDSDKQYLKAETAILEKMQGKDHFCKFFGCGRDERYNYAVMQLVGSNLDELRRAQPRGAFSLSTSLRLAHQILSAIEHLHQMGFLHRDIKPGNFCIGRLESDRNKVYMLDFGLARQYTTASGDVCAPRTSAGFTGTIRYASINTHNFEDMGRRDDLWSLFYMMVEFVNGKLPWSMMKDRNQVGEMKRNYSRRELVKHLPIDLERFLEEIQVLKNVEKPPYPVLRMLLERCMKRHNVRMADPYDWEMPRIQTIVTMPTPLSPRNNNQNIERGNKKNEEGAGASFVTKGRF